MCVKRYRQGPDDPLVRAFSYPYAQADLDGALDLESGELRGLANMRALLTADRRAAGIEHSLPGCRIECADALFAEPRHLLLAAGSNASPEQLLRKFQGRAEMRPILLLKVSVTNAIAVHSAHVTAYGAVAGTLMAWPGALSRLTVLAVTGSQLRRINETESLGRNYHLGVLPAGTLIEAPECPVLFYRSMRGVFSPEGLPLRLDAFEAGGDVPPAVSQRRAIEYSARAVAFQGEGDAFVARLIAEADFRRQVTEALALRAVADGLDGARTLAVRA
ncbi:MAG: hypothetical protein AB7O39_12220 [Flavobacteriaceae bacterium]